MCPTKEPTASDSCLLPQDFNLRWLHKPANNDNSNRQHRHQIYDCSCMQILHRCFKVCRREAGCMSCMHRDVERRDDSHTHTRSKKTRKVKLLYCFARLMHALLSPFQTLSEFSKLQSAFTISLLLHRSSQTCPMLSSFSCAPFALVCSTVHASQAIAIAGLNSSGSPDRLQGPYTEVTQDRHCSNRKSPAEPVAQASLLEQGEPCGRPPIYFPLQHGLQQPLRDLHVHSLGIGL
jgi:hypothetical protein